MHEQTLPMMKQMRPQMQQVMSGQGGKGQMDMQSGMMNGMSGNGGMMSG